ncbi:L-histidine N(alpha)-methyltransferase [Sphingobium aquiterrae]|uniref:L-histidine N(alpha)-methyltransferase n=1 Tax=Sphingobium aquiterrae TaxID=2038656 RepID=UPI003018BE82
MLLTSDIQTRALVDRPLADPAFRRAMLEGFARSPKATPPVWFYDRRGSELFEAITDLPEYYVTRTEARLLADIGPQVAKAVGGGRAVVEFGAGSARKTPLLLEAIAPAAYVPIDISGAFLHDSSLALARRFPGLPVIPIAADFNAPVRLPDAISRLPMLGFFPGSTIGNQEPADAVNLLRAMRQSLSQHSPGQHSPGQPPEQGAMLLIGMDRIKPVERLIPAYDDAAGVTAAFNLNLLHRINRELDGDIPVDAFAHRAIWNESAARIEMHLEALRDIRFHIDGIPFAMAQGETVHSESSHKYGPRDSRLLLRAAGWEPRAEWQDEEALFSLILATATAP